MTFRDLPIKRKLIAVIFLTSLCVLTLTCLALLTYEVFSYKQSTTRNLSTIADIISANSTAALVFDDPKLAREILSGLRAEPEVTAAALYDREGMLYATYPPDLAADTLPATPAPDSITFQTSHVTVYRPVIQSQKRVGTLFLKVDLQEMYGRLNVYALVLVGVLLSSGVLAFFLSSIFERRISQPLLELANTAKVVSEQRDYSVRAVAMSRDELGYLTEAFNSMLDQIQASHSALRKSENRLSVIFNQAGAGIAQCDLSGRYLMVNDGYCEMTGHTREMLLGMSMQDVTFREDVAESLSALENVAKGSPGSVLEKRYVRTNGQLVWARVTIVPLRDVHGSVEFTLAVIQDITERKLAEEAMRESEGRYRQLVSSLPTAIYTTDAHGYVILYNEAAAVLWGRRPEIGKELMCGSHRMFRPDGTPLPLDQCPMAVALREGRPVLGEEFIVERPNGTRRNVLPNPNPIRDVTGRIVGAVNMLLDITESKRAEEASRRLASIVESSEDAVVSKDLNGIVTSWNRGAERLFGYKSQEMIGRPITLLIPEERVGEELTILQRIRRGEPLEHFETFRRRKDGRVVEISLTVSPIKDATGKVIGASKIARNITLQKQAERELERAHKELVAASRAKDDFLAALSHELRTPLNPVLLLASESAEDPNLPVDIRDQFATIRNSVELEARLIDDLLDITRITHGKLVLSLGLVDVHSLLKEAVVTVQSEIHQKQLALTMELAAKSSRVRGDAVRLQQVLWNVLKNAAKFTPKGGSITVKTRREVETRELIITVEDSGIGLTKDELARVFEAFTQGEHAGAGGSHRFGGLGLGLAISRMLVESHSGSIRAISEGRDQGSTFIIHLPLIMETAGAEPIPGDDSFPPRGAVNGSPGRIHILLVEDHLPTRTALAHLLTLRGYEVNAAGSVAEARTCAEKQVFDLLISDIGLPDGNGCELMKELRASNKDLRGIALTGYGMEEDIARSKEAGFSSHLIKPVRMQTLETALAATVPH